MLRDHGRKEKDTHELLGYNLRFNEIQAAIGLVQLSRLSKFNDQRRTLAKRYTELLSDSPVIAPKEMEWARHVYHMYVIRAKKRDQLQKWLKDKGISTGIHYPTPVHLQPGIKAHVPIAKDLENTERLVKEILSLPMHPQLKEEEQSRVSQNIKEFMKAN
jgi:dTDP-4-amino-4,6-dideoxygalactose transaminase